VAFTMSARNTTSVLRVILLLVSRDIVEF